MLEYQFEGVPRRPLVVALKNILTLGIHTKVWLYRINREMDGHEGFHINFRNLGIMVAVPIVTPIIVKFQTARRMDRMVAHQMDLPRIRPPTLGWLSVIPVLGAGFYAYWVQSILNRHWFHHRRLAHVSICEERLAEVEEEIRSRTGGELPPMPDLGEANDPFAGIVTSTNGNGSAEASPDADAQAPGGAVEGEDAEPAPEVEP